MKMCLHGLVRRNNNYASITRHTLAHSAYQILSGAARKMRTLVDKVSGGAAAHRKIVSAAFHSTRETPPTGLCCGIALFISIFIHCWVERREASNAGADCLCARRFCKLIFSSITRQSDGSLSLLSLVCCGWFIFNWHWKISQQCLSWLFKTGIKHKSFNKLREACIRTINCYAT